jgi:hypothetical protein
MGEALDRLAKALASGSSRRVALGGLLTGAAAALPWTTEAKKKKKKRKKKFKKLQTYCNQWCGEKFGFSGKSFNTCVDKAKEGKGACYSDVAQGPGFYCTHVLQCGELNCCPTIDGGEPVKDGECCDGDCALGNGTFFCFHP